MLTLSLMHEGPVFFDDGETTWDQEPPAAVSERDPELDEVDSSYQAWKEDFCRDLNNLPTAN